MNISLAREYSKCLSLFSILIHMLLVIYFTSIILRAITYLKRKKLRLGVHWQLIADK